MLLHLASTFSIASILSGSEAGMLEAGKGQAKHAGVNCKASRFYAAQALNGTIGPYDLSLIIATNLSMT